MWPSMQRFTDLPLPLLWCVCVSECVTVCVGYLFCLPLSIALPCPFLSQLEKGTTPLRPWPSARVCGGSLSWDFGISAVSVPQQ